MRKNAPRKWIHAILDVLPLLVIPIFAININQKSVEPISIEVQEKVSVDFNQLIPSLVSTNWNVYSGTGTYSNNELYVQNAVGRNGFQLVYGSYSKINIVNGHKYLYSSYTKGDGNIRICTNIFTSNQYTNRELSNTTDYVQNNYIIEIVNNNVLCTCDTFPLVTGQTTSFYIKDIMLFDLTQMFGEGNEPTINEFWQYFDNQTYYSKIDSQKMLVNKPTETTYDNTDIGSQFLYSLYKPVNDYFNFNNLFNMNDVWSWIQLNLFQGSAPLPVFMVWNIILYEFFIDLIFLLYSVFMFIIDFATNCLEKPFNKVR